MPKQHLPILKICSCPCQAGPYCVGSFFTSRERSPSSIRHAAQQGGGGGELRGDWPLRRAGGSRRRPFPPCRRSDTGYPCGDRSAASFRRGSGRSQGSASLIRCGLFRFCFQNRPPFTRKVISGFLMLTLVSLSTDSVRKALPPMTTLSPTSVAPPSSVAPA